jgi:hypothetical protein
MRMQERNKRKILYCKQRIHTNGATYYDPPVGLDVNVVPVSSLWNSSLMGVTQQGKYIFSVDASLYANLFSIGDRFYVDNQTEVTEYFPYGTEPWGFYRVPDDDVIEFDGSADTADYVLEAIARTPNVITITLTRLAV